MHGSVTLPMFHSGSKVTCSSPVCTGRWFDLCNIHSWSYDKRFLATSTHCEILGKHRPQQGQQQPFPQCDHQGYAGVQKAVGQQERWARTEHSKME